MISLALWAIGGLIKWAIVLAACLLFVAAPNIATGILACVVFYVAGSAVNYR